MPSGVSMDAAITSFAQLAKLAAAITRPVDGPWQVDCSPLTREQFEALRHHESFGTPLERFALSQSLLPLAKLSRKQVQKLPVSPDGRLAIFLLTEPLKRLEEASLLVCGAAMHVQILSVVARDKRNHLRAALGDDGYQVATLEAPMLYPSLGAHADDGLLEEALAGETAGARDMFAEFGFRLFASAVAVHWRPLAKLASVRWPTDIRLKSLSAKDVQLILRLLQRRLPAW